MHMHSTHNGVANKSRLMSNMKRTRAAMKLAAERGTYAHHFSACEALNDQK